MSLPSHRVPRKVFEELAQGAGGPEAVHILASGQYSKNVLLIRGVRDAAAAVQGRSSPAQAGYELLAAVQRANPHVAQAVISYPSVGAWALRTLRALRGEPPMIGAQPGGLRAIAAAAAIRAGISTEIEVPTVSGLAMLPSLGGAAVDDGVAVVRQGADGAEVLSAGSPIPVPGDPNQEAPGWFAVRQLRAGSFTALIDDVDPFRMPAEPTVADRLRSADIDRWNTVLQEAWALLVTHHSDIARELAAAIRSVVPLAPPAHGQVSTSSAETFGAVALSKPPDARVFAVTLVHEVQHLKLSALLDIVRLVSPDDGRLFYAPWRDDPRPVGGLLQGAYAYVGVSRFWRKQRLLDRGDDALGAHAEFARWRAAALFVVETLEVSGGLTPAGMEFVQGMAHTLRGWQEEAVPKEAQQLADDDAQEHLARWQSANGPVPA